MTLTLADARALGVCMHCGTPDHLSVEPVATAESWCMQLRCLACDLPALGADDSWVKGLGGFETGGLGRWVTEQEAAA